MSDEDLDFVEKEQSALDYVDGRMRALGQCLNLLDPDGTFKGMPSEKTLREIMQAAREDYRKLSDAILALRDEDDEPATKHDGTLSNYQSHPHHVEWAGSEVQILDNTYEYVGLDAKEALSLLAWLEQERDTLEKLAKEQGE